MNDIIYTNIFMYSKYLYNINSQSVNEENNRKLFSQVNLNTISI